MHISHLIVQSLQEDPRLVTNAHRPAPIILPLNSRVFPFNITRSFYKLSKFFFSFQFKIHPVLSTYFIHHIPLLNVLYRFHRISCLFVYSTPSFLSFSLSLSTYLPFLVFSLSSDSFKLIRQYGYYLNRHLIFFSCCLVKT